MLRAMRCFAEFHRAEYSTHAFANPVFDSLFLCIGCLQLETPFSRRESYHAFPYFGIKIKIVVLIGIIWGSKIAVSHNVYCAKGLCLKLAMHVNSRCWIAESEGVLL